MLHKLFLSDDTSSELQLSGQWNKSTWLCWPQDIFTERTAARAGKIGVACLMLLLTYWCGVQSRVKSFLLA